MPTAYVQKLAKKHNVSIKKSEKEWNKAKKRATKEGKGENFAYITSIYKKIMSESTKLTSLKDFLIISETSDVADISYGRDRDEVNDELNDEFIDNEDQDDEDEFCDDEDEFCGDEDDEDDEDEFCDDEDEFCDDEDQDDEDSHKLKDILGPDELNDEESSMRNRSSMELESMDLPKLSMLKELMLITEKSKKVPLKKAARSVYHRDYIKTKTKPYRKYDPEHRGDNK